MWIDDAPVRVCAIIALSSNFDCCSGDATVVAAFAAFFDFAFFPAGAASGMVLLPFRSSPRARFAPTPLRSARSSSELDHSVSGWCSERRSTRPGPTAIFPCSC